MKWYRLAADQGRSDAQYQLGHLYYKQNNYAEAAKWFHLAADQGRADAQSNLGSLYAEGEGIPRDFVQALIRNRKSRQGRWAHDTGTNR
jgi:TPR repeat protein